MVELTGTVMGLMTSGVFWVVFVAILGGVVFGSLLVRKNAKFHYKAIIFTDNGNGKVGMRFTKVGWFKSKKFLGGLLDVSGERRMETKDGRIVQQASSTDLHELGFKPCMLLEEKSDDPKILVPIKRFKVTNLEALMQIAPADFRDASSKIIDDAEKESLSKWETLAQILVYGLLAIVLFISIILVIQYSNSKLAEANKIYQEALGFYEKTANRLSAIPVSGTTAP